MGQMNRCAAHVTQLPTMVKGFTLAEVLITLGIIGIVAAMTIPTLITKQQQKQTIIALKKTYADVLRINKMAAVDYDDPAGWDRPRNNNENEMKSFIEKYYLPYLNGATYYGSTQLRPKYSIFNLHDQEVTNYSSGILLNDGRLLTFFSHGDYIWIYTDINGFKKPNKMGKDIFVFYQYESANNKYTPHFFLDHWNIQGLKTAGSGITENSENKTTSSYGCSKDNKYGYYAGWTCGTLIKKLNWTMPKDYPW